MQEGAFAQLLKRNFHLAEGGHLFDQRRDLSPLLPQRVAFLKQNTGALFKVKKYFFDFLQRQNFYLR